MNTAATFPAEQCGRLLATGHLFPSSSWSAAHCFLLLEDSCTLDYNSNAESNEALISSDSETPTWILSMKIKNCALGKLKKGEFSVIQFVKHMKWTFTEKDLAKRTLEALYELAAETRKEKEGREKELAESKLKKRKMVSLMTTEVIEAVDKHQAKVLKHQTPPALQTISDFFAQDNQHKNFLSIFELGSEDLSAQILHHIFTLYKDYIGELYNECPPINVTEFLESLFLLLQKTQLSEWETYFDNLVEPAVQTLKDIQAVINIKGFENNQAPLNNLATLECKYLNAFIHSVFKECVYKFGNKTMRTTGVYMFKTKESLANNSSQFCVDVNRSGMNTWKLKTMKQKEQKQMEQKQKEQK
ncbi:hypothetical protein HDU77_008265 [Chytriomyces hyalinus]|nr:hypothetical protein HDU77_008265 [Chytriomyces hyalinus]